MLALAEAEQARLRQQAAAAAEAHHIRELEALAPKEEYTWTFATQLLEQGYGHYEEVVEILVKLHSTVQTGLIGAPRAVRNDA